MVSSFAKPFPLFSFIVAILTKKKDIRAWVKQVRKNFQAKKLTSTRSEFVS